MPQAGQQGNGDSQQDAMMNSMKTMNTVMPLMISCNFVSHSL